MNLIIDHREYSKQTLLDQDIATIQEGYFIDIVLFLREWWNDETYVIAKTSGSTGQPKEIRLNKNSMRASARATGQFFDFPKKICSPLSAQYIAGKMMLVRAIEWNAEIHCIKPSENPLIQVDEFFDFMVMTPHQLSHALSSEDAPNVNNLKHLLLGGSPVDQVLENKIQNLKTRIYLGYGMTETMSHVAWRALKGDKRSNEYKAVVGVAFSVDEQSCLQIDAKALSKELIKTNDVVDLLDPTSFIWRSRLDHVINTGGIKVFPKELEDQIRSMIPYPFYIAAKSDERLGQKVCLILETDGLTDEHKNQLLQQIKKVLPKYSSPREIIELKSFEYTANGKLKRKQF